MIRAIIIEDQPDLAEALRETVEFDGSVDVVAVCHTLGVSAEVIGHLQPDVIVTDFRLPDGDAVDEFAAWRSIAPRSRILVVSAWTDERSIRRARDAGAQGYLEKGPELDVLPDVISLLAGGGTQWLDAPEPHSGGGRRDLDDVSLLVLNGICEGLATIALADQLSVSESTVRRHVNALLRSFGARTRSELVELVGPRR